MNKIKEIIIGTNNIGKSKEICDLLPKNLKKYFPKEFNILSPKENGKSFEENSFIKASYFSKKTNLICLSDDSGLEIGLLKDQPGIYSSRWSGYKNNFDFAIKKVFPFKKLFLSKVSNQIRLSSKKLSSIKMFVAFKKVFFQIRNRAIKFRYPQKQNLFPNVL